MGQSIWRATTPTMAFTNIPVAEDDVAVGYLTFVQAGKVVLEKSNDDFEYTESGIKVYFSQEDTLKFEASKPLEFQLTFKTVSGNRISSVPITTTVRKAFKDEVI